MSEQAEYVKSLEYALKTERDGHAMYGQAAQSAASPLARATFQMLAQEELKHIRIIETFHHALSGAGQWPDLDAVRPGEHADLVEGVVTVFQQRAGEFREQAPTADDTKAYELALDFESRARAYYREQLDQASDELARTFFAFMQEEEHRHYVFLEETLDYLDDTKQWFAKHERPFYTAG